MLKSFVWRHPEHQRHEKFKQARARQYLLKLLVMANVYDVDINKMKALANWGLVDEVYLVLSMPNRVQNPGTQRQEDEWPEWRINAIMDEQICGILSSALKVER